MSGEKNGVKRKGHLCKEEKDMNFQSVDSMQSVVNVVNEQQ